MYKEVMQLAAMPNVGKIGELPGTRELLFHPWPHIAVYKVTSDAVRIIRIRHASQRWP
nr:type II toxin-antitoxin system RelE/ParE family toxin [Granulicella mallensis]